MKTNLFSETIIYWKHFDRDEKLKRLQKLEIENSKNQGRGAREVVFRELERGIRGTYRPSCPDYLFIDDAGSDRLPATVFVDANYHEGYHALIDDVFSKGLNLVAISNPSKNDLIKKMIALRIAYNLGFINQDDAYTLDEQEKVVKTETALYLLSNFLDICETEEDCENMFFNYIQLYVNMYGQFRDYEKLNPDTKALFKNFTNVVDCCDELDNSQLKNYDFKDQVIYGLAKARKQSMVAKAGRVVRTTIITPEQARFLKEFLSKNLALVTMHEGSINPVEKKLAGSQLAWNFELEAPRFNL